MALFANVYITNLAGAKRLDADYYKSTYDNKPIALHKKLELGQICSTIRKGIFDIKADTYCNSKNGVPFVRISDLYEGLIDSNRIVHIPHGIHQQQYKTIMRNGDFVLSKTAKPAASLVFFNECNISQDIIGMTLKQEYIVSILTGYIVVYLNTVYGLAQMERWFQGNIQKHLGLEGAKRITIPLFSMTFQHVIDKMLRESQICVVASNDLYKQAQDILVRNADFNDYNIDKKYAWYSMLMETQKSFRLDPEFWHPKFELIKQHFLEKGALEYIGNLLTYNNRGLQPDYIKDGKILVVNSQHLGNQHIDIDSLEQTNQRFWDNNPRSRIFKNDILLYTTGAYLGRTNIWLEDQKAIASNHVNILRVDESKCNPAYLAFFLNSDYGIMQSKRWQSGSGQQEIYPSDIGQMMVYLPSKDVQDEIAECVIKSYFQLSESKRLLDVAKKAVEIAIEESEERAMQYLNENQATSIEY